MWIVFVYTLGMKTAVPEQTDSQEFTNYFILGVGLLFMFMAFMLLMIIFATPKQTAVSPTPVPTIKPIQVSADPVQTAVTGETITWQRKNYTWKLTPRAQIQVTGRILSRRTYTQDWQSEISPLDFAIGWGELYDTEVDNWVKWQQSGRWYYYRWPHEAPFDKKYLLTHSSNVHIIPASDNLETALLKIREDDRIILEGKLVDIEATSETKRWWNETSLTRTDSGNGACEILLVERLIWNGQEYH